MPDRHATTTSQEGTDMDVRECDHCDFVTADEPHENWLRITCGNTAHYACSFGCAHELLNAMLLHQMAGPKPRAPMTGGSGTGTPPAT